MAAYTKTEIRSVFAATQMPQRVLAELANVNESEVWALLNDRYVSELSATKISAALKAVEAWVKTLPAHPLMRDSSVVRGHIGMIVLEPSPELAAKLADEQRERDAEATKRKKRTEPNTTAALNLIHKSGVLKGLGGPRD